ncbi:MAG: alpha/beta hydrolase [Planctomycetes bacterium]|nr:alpha/beta hydrolase [Planctomycetota bacterium]
MDAEKHIYRTEPRDLFIDIYRPQNSAGSLPVIVFFFGGGWNGGTPDQFRPFAQRLAERGMVAAVAEYRTKTSDDVEPYDCVIDGKSAMRYLRENAKTLGIDPNRIVAAGGSAGGHVAATTACVERWNHSADNLAISPRPNALVLLNPVINNGPDNFGFERVGDYYQDFSPFHRVHSHWPPTTIMQGTEDDLISVNMMQEFAENIRQHGARCEEHYYDKQPHGFFNFNDGNNPYYHKCLEILDTFMCSLEYIEPQ